MQRIKVNLWLVSFITALIIPIFIFNSLVFDIHYYRAQFLKLDIYSQESEANKIANEILNFFNSKGELSTERLTLAEKSHLADVKQVFDNLRILMYFLTALLLFIFFIILKKIRNKNELKGFLARYFLTTAIILFAILIILAFALANFPSAFQGMHDLLFPQGNYAFPESSTLIILFPEQFFISFAWQLVINIVIFALFLLGFSFALKKLY